MKPSIRREASMFDQPVPEVSRSPAGVTRLPNVSSGNDASHSVAASLGGEAWAWRRLRPTAQSDAETSSLWPTYRLHQEAQRRRAGLLGDAFAAAMQAGRVAVSSLYRRYCRFRRAQETYTTLRELDDRTLRDLGFTRDEIRSVATEMASDAVPTRRLARPTFPARQSLFQLLFGK